MLLNKKLSRVPDMPPSGNAVRLPISNAQETQQLSQVHVSDLISRSPNEP